MLAVISEGTWTIITGLMISALVAPTWLGWWNSRLARKQVLPNGGASLKDQVTRVEGTLTNISNTLNLHTDQIKFASDKAYENNIVVKDIMTRMGSVEANQGKSNVQINTERAQKLESLIDLHAEHGLAGEEG